MEGVFNTSEAIRLKNEVTNDYDYLFTSGNALELEKVLALRDIVIQLAAIREVLCKQNLER